MSKSAFTSTALIALALMQPLGVGAATISLTASKDATIFENNFDGTGNPNLPAGNGATQSSGAGPGLFAGSNSNLSPRRALLAFDVAGNVPTGATINSVQLQLKVGQIAGSAGAVVGGDQTTRTIDLFKLNSDWGEGITQAGSTTIGGTGQGAPANPGDATWTQNKFGTSSWTTPGGAANANGTASATVNIQGGLVSGSSQDQVFTWASNQLTADVQAMLNSPSTNFGWLIKNQTEFGQSAFQSFRSFYSKEAEGVLANAIGPRLIIDYTAGVAPVPVPAAMWLFGSGFAALVGFARRKNASA